jgi:hypothetical protein
VIKVELTALRLWLTGTGGHENPGLATLVAIKVLHQQALGLARSPLGKLVLAGDKPSRGKHLEGGANPQVLHKGPKTPGGWIHHARIDSPQHLVVGLAATDFGPGAQLGCPMTQCGKNQVGFLAVIHTAPKGPEHLRDDDIFPVIKMRT